MNNNKNGSNCSFKKVFDDFVISRYEIFESRADQEYLKLVFRLKNENESFEVDQIFPIDSLGQLGFRYELLLDQFEKFYGEIDRNVDYEDFVGERGSCFLKQSEYKGRFYQQVVFVSLGKAEERGYIFNEKKRHYSFKRLLKTP